MRAKEGVLAITSDDEADLRRHALQMGRLKTLERMGLWDEMVGAGPMDGLTGATTYHWTQLQNILRDPFETTVAGDKSLLAYGGALAAPSTAYLYNWNILPIGQALWLKELESYVEFPPLQDPASYNLTQVYEQVKKQSTNNPGQ